MDTSKISTKIEADFESSHLDEIRRFIKQPSVSADGNGIQETAIMLSKKIEKLDSYLSTEIVIIFNEVGSTISNH